LICGCRVVRKRNSKNPPLATLDPPGSREGDFVTLPRAAVTTESESNSWEGREASNASDPGRAKDEFLQMLGMSDAAIEIRELVDMWL
jgi:hypothetical protein